MARHFYKSLRQFFSGIIPKRNLLSLEIQAIIKLFFCSARILSYHKAFIKHCFWHTTSKCLISRRNNHDLCLLH